MIEGIKGIRKAFKRITERIKKNRNGIRYKNGSSAEIIRKS